jgi:phosphoglycolate phosphatase-like HAD superfamily hydrolase
MLAAQAHGIPAIGVTWGIGTHGELHEAGADRIIHEPEALPGTAAILLDD